MRNLYLRELWFNVFILTIVLFITFVFRVYGSSDIKSCIWAECWVDPSNGKKLICGELSSGMLSSREQGDLFIEFPMHGKHLYLDCVDRKLLKKELNNEPGIKISKRKT